MRCPYCHEIIGTGALVCAACGRDLVFYIPLKDQIDEIEQRVSTLEDRFESDPVRSEERSVSTWIHGFSVEKVAQLNFFVLALGACLLVAWASDTLGSWILRFNLGLTYGVIEVITNLVGVFVVGLVVGLWLKGVHTLAYLLIGLLSGLIPALTGLTQWIALGGIALGVATTLSFTSGGLLGDLIERFRHPTSERSKAERLAARFLRTHTRPASDASIKRLGDIIAAIGPLLSFLGTITSGIFAFLSSR